MKSHSEFDNEKEKIEVLIEPVIKKKWCSRLITRLITKNKLITYSLEVNEVAIKISLRGKEGEKKSIPDKLILRDFNLEGKRSIRTWNKIFEIKGSELEKGIEIEERLKVVFPYEDLFFLSTTVDVEPDNFIIETKQRWLTGEELDGWRKGEPKNICYMPIGAVNFLNFRLTIYTAIILFVTIAILIITFW